MKFFHFFKKPFDTCPQCVEENRIFYSWKQSMKWILIGGQWTRTPSVRGSIQRTTKGPFTKFSSNK